MLGGEWLVSHASLDRELAPNAIVWPAWESPMTPTQYHHPNAKFILCAKCGTQWRWKIGEKKRYCTCGTKHVRKLAPKCIE